ncbi:hypothetical protein GCM10009760_60620 [Kitasatospora kazusensis]|uniref:Uncharacterized protein n=1 Tax=Kitasatospora kazusensis TaxID=407974 RepID=A0ABP5M0M3_9ACTN
MSARNTPGQQIPPIPEATSRTVDTAAGPPGWSPLADYDPEVSRRATGLIPQAYEGCSCARCRTLLAATGSSGAGR